MTFLRNHKDLISGMDFFAVPTVRFRLLYVWFVLDHGRRRLLYLNVTENPTAAWVIQQLHEAFPDQPSHRFLIFDNDAIFSTEVVASAVAVSGAAPALERGGWGPLDVGVLKRRVGHERHHRNRRPPH
jgi:hypothetical protein